MYSCIFNKTLERKPFPFEPFTLKKTDRDGVKELSYSAITEQTDQQTSIDDVEVAAVGRSQLLAPLSKKLKVVRK